MSLRSALSRLLVLVLAAFVLLPFVFVGFSYLTALRSKVQTGWIQGNIKPGMTRSDIYEKLRSQGLIAYNRLYIKAKLISAPHAPTGNPEYDEGCDWNDTFSGAWPYKGEPLPKQKGICAEMQRRNRPPKDPSVEIALPGAANFFCSWTTYVTIAFGDDDRAKTMTIARDEPFCI